MDRSTSLSFSVHDLPKESAYQRIDAEISNLEEQIRALRTLRNSISPISSLPSELLSKVFWHSCGFDGYLGIFSLYEDEDSEQHEFELDSSTRLTVSWVSGHWRQVAHGCPQLWNIVYEYGEEISPEYVAHCNRLSRGLGLCVDLAEPEDETVEASMSQLDRVQYLGLLFYLFTALEHLEPCPMKLLSGAMWMQPAPILRELKIDRASILERNIFSGVFPQLTHVELSFCQFDWDIPLLCAPTLRSLCTYHSAKKITVPRLLRLLQSLPCLIDFKEIDCLKSTRAPGPRVARRIQLPNLRTLIINDDVALTTDLLLRLDTPEASIETDQYGPDPKYMKQFLTVFQGKIGRQWNSIHHLGSRHTPRRSYLSISTSSTTTYGFDFLTCHDKDIEIWSKFHFVKFACENLPVTNLHSCSTNRLSIEAATLLGRLQHLNKLRLIEESAVQSFITALREHDGPRPADMDGHPATHTSSVLFPSLQELALAKIDSPSAYSGLLDVLTTRKANGFGLKRLAFSKSKISVQDTATLSMVVDVVSFPLNLLR
ncbi:hypothetical protein BDN72DRAFT_902469 [Pluteus cervinus]|uniref:Uncharacterized protein n=1 Tax=Pluteus cervinus TaxID=181527 RepID=A0ACD3ACI5_9AGAR|nr:hypothetical protein BDN72DRAFT_902469 [Pluteus cervinus]